MITKVVLYSESYGKEYHVELNHDEFDFLIEHCNNDVQTIYQYISLKGGWKPIEENKQMHKTYPIKIRGEHPEWTVWRDDGVYYARNVDTGIVYSNTSLTNMMNAITDEMPK